MLNRNSLTFPGESLVSILLVIAGLNILSLTLKLLCSVTVFPLNMILSTILWSSSPSSSPSLFYTSFPAPSCISPFPPPCSAGLSRCGTSYSSQECTWVSSIAITSSAFLDIPTSAVVLSNTFPHTLSYISSCILSHISQCLLHHKLYEKPRKWL